MKRIIFCIAAVAISLAAHAQGELIATTYYDQQTNASTQNRIYYFDDGTIGATLTWGMEPPSYNDRGTGYNYFDGTSWTSWPTQRIESMRTGWPSYAPLGSEGELVVAHLSGADTVGLLFSKRTVKGEGDWAESLFTGPAGYEALYWPRMVTGGSNHDHIFMIAMTAPETNGGNPYQGLNGALLYSRSTDGGNIWDIHNQILQGMDSTEFEGFMPDGYAFAEPLDNTVAFVVGSRRTDMFLMKSTDYGATFEKTIIWDNPCDTILPQDTLYHPDASMAIALDPSGKAHVAFGIINSWYDGNWYYDPMVDGIGYWNEDMPAFSSNYNALNPQGGAGSEMVADYNLIAWTQDINGNGQIEIDEVGNYLVKGISSMPQLIIDEANRVFLVYTSVTEGFNNGVQNYRRLWCRASPDGGNTWGEFHIMCNDLIYIFEDFIFPSCAAKTNDCLHCVFLHDIEPDLNMFCETYVENSVKYLSIPKDDIVGLNTPKENPAFEVTFNIPNPFTESAIVTVTLSEPSELTFDLLNLLGQKVTGTSHFKGITGVNNLKIERSGLASGVYYYNVRTGEKSISKKMIIN
ncbi:MAG: T9SS type A sorting domain-containing protein [Bacteroidetes bacterium]|nr:T9SS type A sorting domain-containing protein [Bacteroidota bacterium]